MKERHRNGFRRAQRGLLRSVVRVVAATSPVRRGIQAMHAPRTIGPSTVEGSETQAAKTDMGNPKRGHGKRFTSNGKNKVPVK